MPEYKRVLIKFSGEALNGDGEEVFDQPSIKRFASELVTARELGVDVGIVVGAGNLVRGEEFSQNGMNRATADYMGMLGTVINALVLQDAIEKLGVQTRVMSAVEVKSVSEPYIRRRAIRHLEKGRIIIIAGGTGNPYFTTDTAAALRGTEIEAEIIMKGTNVDGVYDKDPNKHSDAKLYTSLSFTEVIRQELKVMDATAFQLCRENNMPIRVFNLKKEGNLVAAVKGEDIGTYVGKV